MRNTVRSNSLRLYTLLLFTQHYLSIPETANPPGTSLGLLGTSPMSVGKPQRKKCYMALYELSNRLNLLSEGLLIRQFFIIVHLLCS